jgi:hypothetical protein
MHRGALATSVALCALVSGSGASAAAHSHLIYRVDKVSAIIEGTKLVIEANGAVASGGWTHTRLRAKPAAPEAHVLQLDFIADPPPPKKIVIQSLLPAKAELRRNLPHYGTIAVSVVSQTNEITAQIQR